MVEAELEKIFPNLKSPGYSIKSPISIYYNCIAWAANEADRWWWPDVNEQYYWPAEVKREESLTAFIKAFGLLGFKPCKDSKLEPGFEKVAIYVDRDGKPSHAARQLPSGMWTSKLGNLEDIEHTFEGLENSHYGKVAKILKRPIRRN